MCQNSIVHDAQQIEQCVAQGMPQKIVKSVKYTIRKRLEAEQKQQQQQQEQQQQEQEQQKQKQQQNEQIKSCPAQAALKASRTLAAAATATTTPAVSSAVTESSINAKRSLLCPYFRQQKKEALAAHNSDTGEAHTTNNNNISNSNSKNSHSNSSSNSNATVYNDALAISTQWTKQQLARLGRTVENLKNSKIYTLLTRTTQPAHVIAICILSFILLTVWPEIIENTSGAEETDAASSLPSQTEPSSWHHLAVIAYLGAFATHFGAQIWMTFVSGLSLYFALPRHTFGQCQQILFPKYFALNAVLSISMLILFVKFFLGQLSVNSCIQLASLTLTALIEVIVRLYLAPPMLRLMLEKYKIEGTVGSGQEVGGLVQGDLVQCPHYQRIHKTFRRIHMTVAIGNIVVLVCTCMHLYYLASKIRLS